MDLNAAQQAVLVKSESLENKNFPIVEGYNFGTKENVSDIDYDALLKSYLTTGFQATNLALVIQVCSYGLFKVFLKEINKMIEEREKSIEVLLVAENLEPLFECGRRCRALTIFLGYTSNMVTSGLRDIFRFLVEHDFVDCIVTSAGGIEEDLIKCLKPTFVGILKDFYKVVGDFRLNGSTLRQKGLNRAGNLLIPNDNYCAFEEWLMPILDECLNEQNDLINSTFWTPAKVLFYLLISCFVVNTALRKRN